MKSLHTEREKAMTVRETVEHPERKLAEELAELGLSASEFAEGMKVPPNRVPQILKGQRGITADTALRLGHFFGTSPMGWMNLQSRWDVVQAHKAVWREVKALPMLKGWRSRGNL